VIKGRGRERVDYKNQHLRGIIHNAELILDQKPKWKSFLAVSIPGRITSHPSLLVAFVINSQN
jgi:hypothetical protein